MGRAGQGQDEEAVAEAVWAGQGQVGAVAEAVWAGQGQEEEAVAEAVGIMLACDVQAVAEAATALPMSVGRRGKRRLWGGGWGVEAGCWGCLACGEAAGVW